MLASRGLLGNRNGRQEERRWDVNGPHTSTGTATAGWRDEILREFTPGAARLTVVDDPDGLLAEAGVVEALGARGFEVVSLNDRIAFRFFYESRYRSRRNRGDLGDVVAVFTGARHEHVVPYDLWRASRRLSFSLEGLFPRLSWAVVQGMDRSDLDALYAAQAQESPKRRLGLSGTGRFALRHVFGIAPETIKQASDLLRLLLRLHYCGLRLPWPLERHLVGACSASTTFAARVASFKDVTRHPQNDRTRCLGPIASRRHPRPGTGRPEVHPGPEARRGTRRAPIPSPTVRRVS